MLTICKGFGMMLEGRIPNSRLYRGKHYYNVKFGLLREEWETMQNN